ncbi:MAG: hypothetical protein Q9208_004601 [Pyrenodesmia sp. 3 TL-2023]
MDLRDYDQQIREARDHYASERPDFALTRYDHTGRASAIQIGELKDIILANATGRRPEDPDSSSVFYLKAREWDERFFFWTLDLGDQRVIVKSIGAPSLGGAIYRRWLGVDQKFEKKAIAFPNLDGVAVNRSSGASESSQQLVNPAAAKKSTADRPQRQKYASKRRAEQLTLRSNPKKPRIPSNVSSKSNSAPTDLRLRVGTSGPKGGLSSSNNESLPIRRCRLQPRHGLQDDESSDTSALSSPPTTPRSTIRLRPTSVRPRKTTAQAPSQKEPHDNPGVEVGQAATITPPSSTRPPTTQSSLLDQPKLQNRTENEIEELSKELNAIRRRKEELAQQE